MSGWNFGALKPRCWWLPPSCCLAQPPAHRRQNCPVALRLTRPMTAIRSGSAMPAPARRSGYAALTRRSAAMLLGRHPPRRLARSSPVLASAAYRWGTARPVMSLAINERRPDRGAVFRRWSGRRAPDGRDGHRLRLEAVLRWHLRRRWRLPEVTAREIKRRYLLAVWSAESLSGEYSCTKAAESAIGPSQPRLRETLQSIVGKEVVSDRGTQCPLYKKHPVENLAQVAEGATKPSRPVLRLTTTCPE